jgi:hypothetical protein
MFMVISPVRAALRYMLAPEVSAQVIAPVVVALVCTVWASSRAVMPPADVLLCVPLCVSVPVAVPEKAGAESVLAARVWVEVRSQKVLVVPPILAFRPVAAALVVQMDPFVGVVGATPCGSIRDSCPAVVVAVVIAGTAVMPVDATVSWGVLFMPTSTEPPVGAFNAVCVSLIKRL